MTFGLQAIFEDKELYGVCENIAEISSQFIVLLQEISKELGMPLSATMSFRGRWKRKTPIRPCRRKNGIQCPILTSSMPSRSKRLRKHSVKTPCRNALRLQWSSSNENDDIGISICHA